MKYFVLFLCAVFAGFSAYADNITLNWLNEDGTTNQTTTCTIGGDLNLPSNPPTKTGYNFVGWKFPDYIPIEYLQNEPSATYIDTGHIGNSLTKIIIDYEPYLTPSSHNKCPIFGTTNLLIRCGLSGRRFRVFSFGAGSIQSDLGTTAGDLRHKFILSKAGVSMDDGEIQTFSNSNLAQTASSLLVFADTVSDISNCTDRVYSLQIYQDDVLVHDYVPALDLDMVPGLYDKIDKVFLYNAGTGDFVAGPVIGYD